MKGIVVNNSKQPRTLDFNDEQVATGGDNLQGLSAQGDNLLLDGKVIATSSNRLGLHVQNGALYFGDAAIIGGVIPPIGPDEPSEPETTSLWLPPTQSASSYKPYDYNGLIERYDTLMSSHPSYITKSVYGETGYGDYPLVSYTLTPENYTKTFYIQAGIHGNEHDAVQTLLRIVEILCDHTNESAYSALRPLRNNIRFVIIPCVHPWGWDNSSMNRPYEPIVGDNDMMNMNRNLDFNHQYALSAAGSGGNYPWQVPETRHIKFVMESIGYENIDYAIDYHDGGDVKEHFWINYNMDGNNGEAVRKLVSDLVAYEEKNYPQYKDAEKGWVTFHCADSAGYSTGTTIAYMNCSAGVNASVCEYIGGYFGYNFNAEQMTRSLRIRANMLLCADKIAKAWTISEEDNATRFRFDTPRALTRDGLRFDGADKTYSQTIVTQSQIYQRWDALAAKYPSYIRKSASLGQNLDGEEIYSYQLGAGAKKVLFVGGSLRWGAAHKETEFGAYSLAENLCSDYLVAQSALLQQLRDNYTIVVLPCIDATAGGNDNGRQSIGLNCMALPSYRKWQLVDDKCQPTSYATNTAKDIPILLSFLNAHSDARLILSGGEDTTGYAFESPKYNTEYMTQFILPKNMLTPSWLTDFAAYLESERGETTPDIVSTDGKTFADYVFDNMNIPALYLNLQLDGTWDTRKQYTQEDEQAGSGAMYFYRNYETGRRLAAIVNIMLAME